MGYPVPCDYTYNYFFNYKMQHMTDDLSRGRRIARIIRPSEYGYRYYNPHWTGGYVCQSELALARMTTR